MRKCVLMLLINLVWLPAKAQSNPDVSAVEFTSVARGYQKKITITADSVASAVRGSENETSRRAVNKKDWKKLLKCVNEINLSELPQLKSPTMKRSYDGARHSTITIITKEQSWSHSFDDEYPNARVKPILEIIKRIALKNSQ